MTRIADEKLFVRTFRMDARLPTLWLSTAYPEPLFPTGYARIAKNAKTWMRRSKRLLQLPQKCESESARSEISLLSTDSSTLS